MCVVFQPKTKNTQTNGKTTKHIKHTGRKTSYSHKEILLILIICAQNQEGAI